MSWFKCLILLCTVAVAIEAASLHLHRGRAVAVKNSAKQKVGSKKNAAAAAAAHSESAAVKGGYNLKEKIEEAQILIHSGIRSIKENLNDYTTNNKLPRLNETNWNNLNATLENKISKLKEKITARNSPSQQEAIWEAFVSDFEKVSGAFVHNVSQEQQQNKNKTNEKSQTIIVIVLEKGFGSITKELKDLPNENLPGNNYAERSNQIPKTIFALLSVFTHSTEASVLQNDQNPTSPRPLQVLAGQIGQAISNLGSFRPPAVAQSEDASHYVQPTNNGSTSFDSQENQSIPTSSQRPLQALAGQISQAINSLVTPRPAEDGAAPPENHGPSPSSSPRPLQVLAGQISQAIQNINNLAFRPPQTLNGSQPVVGNKPQRPPQVAVVAEQTPVVAEQAPVVAEQTPEKIELSTSPPRIVVDQNLATSSDVPLKSEENSSPAVLENSTSEAPVLDSSSAQPISSEFVSEADDQQPTEPATTLNPQPIEEQQILEKNSEPSAEILPELPSPSSEDSLKPEPTEPATVPDLPITESPEPRSTELPIIPENPLVKPQSEIIAQPLPENPPTQRPYSESPPRAAPSTEIPPAPQPLPENPISAPSIESFITETEKRPISNQVLNIITDKRPTQSIINDKENENVPVSNQALNVIINIIYDKAVAQTSNLQSTQSLNYHIPQRLTANNRDENLEQDTQPQAIQIMVTDSNEQAVSNRVVNSDQLLQESEIKEEGNDGKPVSVVINLSTDAQSDGNPDQEQPSVSQENSSRPTPIEEPNQSTERLPNNNENEQIALKPEPSNNDNLKTPESNSDQEQSEEKPAVNQAGQNAAGAPPAAPSPSPPPAAAEATDIASALSANLQNQEVLQNDENGSEPSIDNKPSSSSTENITPSNSENQPLLIAAEQEQISEQSPQNQPPQEQQQQEQEQKEEDKKDQVVQAANFTVLSQPDSNSGDDNKNSIHVLIISSPKALKN